MEDCLLPFCLLRIALAFSVFCHIQWIKPQEILAFHNFHTLLIKNQIFTKRMGKVLLAHILMKIEDLGVAKLKGRQIAYYSDEVRKFIQAPSNPENFYIRVRKDIE